MPSSASIEANKQDAEALTAFLPQMRETDLCPATQWHTEGGFPHPQYEQWVYDFLESASRECWMDFGYDPVRGVEAAQCQIAPATKSSAAKMTL